MTNSTQHLLLFTTDVQLAMAAEAAGVDGLIVDWERLGKQSRQSAYPTEIGSDTAADLSRLAEQVSIPITVRLNSFSNHTAEEVECALHRGASSLLLPMARTPAELEMFLQLVNSRARVGVMIETPELIRECKAVQQLDWDFAYIGLNDLMIARKERWLWEPLVDGTVDSILQILAGRMVGFGGITVVGEGAPLRFTSLLREMSRLDCRLGFLRRSFKRDIIGRDINVEIQAIRAVWKAAESRNTEAITSDRIVFRNELNSARPDSR